MKIKVNTIKELTEFFAGRKILITDGHEWEGEVTDFVCMVNKDGSIPKPEDKPNVDLRMRVKTRFNTELDLEQRHSFIIEKTIRQYPHSN